MCGGGSRVGRLQAGIGELGSYRGARGSSETCTAEGQLWKQCEEGWATQVALVGKNPPANAGDTGSIRVGKIPWSRKRHPPPASLPGKSRGQRGLAGYSHGVAESRDAIARRDIVET